MKIFSIIMALLAMALLITLAVFKPQSALIILIVAVGAGTLTALITDYITGDDR